MRAICPNCGGKIHTQPRGLGAITWMASGSLVKTGTECQHCGVALTGRVNARNYAIRVPSTPFVEPIEREKVSEDVAARRAAYLAEQAARKNS